MRVLVLGGTQFIGRAIVSALLGEHDVTVLNRGRRPLWDPAIQQIIADRDRPIDSGVYAESRYGAIVDVSGTAPHQIQNILDATPSLADAHYIFISSASVYDRTNSNPPFAETDAADGDAIWGGYGHDKAACEKLLGKANLGSLTVLRPPYVYGPRNNEQREQFIWARILSDRPVYVPGPEQVEIQFCYVDHLAAVVSASCAGTLPTGTYNLGEHAFYSLGDYIDLLGEVAGKKACQIEVTDTTIRPRDYFPFRKADLTLDVTKIGASAVPSGPTLEVGMLRR